VSIHISQTLRSKLPEAERDTIEEALWEKSKQHCYLCEEKLNRAADSIEPDHDIPEADGGQTALSNLNLAHAECNRAKRNAKTVPIRPYLKLKAFLRRTGPVLKYDGILPHFGINPKACHFEVAGNVAKFELPDGSHRDAPIHSESNPLGHFEYVFVELPREAMFNDNEVQPRTIKEAHAWRIYADLQHNPLHEPPSARIVSDGTMSKLVMFDGQHKTIANWMMDRASVVVKVYLNLDTNQATRLVNSIQSSVPKLPLSPFEIAAKMEQEWRARLDEYEAAVGPEDASEEGFLRWLPQIDRARARRAFTEALIQGQLDNPDLRVRAFVRRSGEAAPAGGLAVNEATLKNKVLGRMVRTKPLPDKGEAFTTYRLVEVENVAFLLNALTDRALMPQEGEEALSPARVAAARRMLYQSSLAYICDLLVKLFQHTTMVDELGQRRLDASERTDIEARIGRLVDHPVWSEDHNRDDRMKAVQGALERNQEARAAFEEVALDLAYLVVGPDYPAYKTYWRATPT
jgi:hypothetical protein